MTDFEKKYSEIESKLSEIDAKKQNEPDAFSDRSFNLAKTNLEKAKNDTGFLVQAEKSINDLNNGYTRLSSFPALTEKFAKESGSPIHYFDSVEEYNKHLKTLPEGAKVFGVVRVGSAKNAVAISHCVAAYTEVGKDSNNTYVYDTLGEVATKNKYYGFDDEKSKVVYTAKNTQKSDKGCFENSEFFLDVVARNNFTFKDLIQHVPTNDVKQTGLTTISDVKQFPTCAIKSLETKTDRTNLNKDITTRKDKSFKYLSFANDDNANTPIAYSEEQKEKFRRYSLCLKKLEKAQGRLERLGIQEEIDKYYSEVKKMKLPVGNLFVEKLYNKNGTSKVAVEGETRLFKQEPGKAVIKERQLANEKAFSGVAR